MEKASTIEVPMAVHMATIKAEQMQFQPNSTEPIQPKLIKTDENLPLDQMNWMEVCEN